MQENRNHIKGIIDYSIILEVNKKTGGKLKIFRD